MIRFWRILRGPAFCVALCAAYFAGRAASAELSTETVPFRVRLEVRVEAKHGMRQYLERAVARELPNRLEAAIGPLSRVDLALVPSFPLLDASHGVGPQPASTAGEQVVQYDKVLHVNVKESYESFRVFAQDYDVRARYLCPPVRREGRQRAHVVDVAIDALLQGFSPVAEFQQIPEDSEHVLIKERRVPPATGAAHALRLSEGDVLIPVLRREAPAGQAPLVETQVVPWTVLVVEELEDAERRCRVVGSSRHPLGVRRRGRIEQLAVAVRPTPAPVTLHLVTQVEPRRPLPGCGVFIRNVGDAKSEPTTRVGVTDQAGRIEIPPGEGPLQVAWIKSGGLLLGKLPLVFGLHDSIDVPLAEDPARIQAEADLTAVRTELVDLVARRNILLARSRAALKGGDLALARRLADQLDKLPTRAQFNQRIDSVVRTTRSQDRLTQSRIERLVEETRSVLGQYLDPRQVGELRNQIIEAADRHGG